LHETTKYSHLPYRRGVGITLFNKEGKVFVGARFGSPDRWQMPQGGIEENEDPLEAVFREMEEEIGTRNAEILETLNTWLHYDVPDYLVPKLWDGKYRGQKQKWIAFRFLGEDSDIKLDAFDKPEFKEWKWVEIEELIDIAMPFKRHAYEHIMRSFQQHAIPTDDDE